VGGDAAASALVRASVRYAFKVRRRTTRVTSLVVANYEAGVAVRLRCRGGGGPFKTRTVTKVKGKRLSLTSRVRRASFRSGAALEVWVTKPGTVGKALRIALRSGKSPRVTSLCVPAGATAAKACS
jgi:hypothetical protein